MVLLEDIVCIGSAKPVATLGNFIKTPGILLENSWNLNFKFGWPPWQSLSILYKIKEIVVHIRALKQALDYGLILKKVHRVIEFRQEGWLKP